MNKDILEIAKACGLYATDNSYNLYAKELEAFATAILADSKQEPVAWNIGNYDNSFCKLGAIYHSKITAQAHIDSYADDDTQLSLVPLYLHPSQDKQEPVGINPIEFDNDMDRAYIPVNSRYEVQTKGKGSSFRIANTMTKERWLIANEHLHPMLTEMAYGTHAEMRQLSAHVSSFEAECARLKVQLTDISLANLKYVETLKYVLHDMEGRGRPANFDASDLAVQYTKCKQKIIEALGSDK
jgi:hypothetical protein